MDDELYRLLSFVRGSEYRSWIIQSLAARGRPEIPKEISAATGIRSDHVSRQLQQLNEQELVTVLNPDAARYRYYTLTEKGQRFVDQVRKLEDDQETTILPRRDEDDG
jgi:DNA-binding MarR family transcriptional regulator